MAKKNRHRSYKKIDAFIDDILRGRARPSARQLIEAIHRINPTGQEASRDRTARLYRIKSRLQSILVERFRDDLDVRSDTTNPNVVLIFHRTLGLDGCHALIDELDIEARSWVRLALDMSNAPAPLSAKSAPPSTSPETDTAVEGHSKEMPELDAEALVEKGRASLEAYDYDDALACFEAAWRKKPEDAGTTATLLDFLVNHMGDYERGLEIATAPQTAPSDDNRVLGALAAARIGRLEEAVRLAGKLEVPALCEVWLKKADLAIGENDWKEATAFVEKARLLSPDDAGLLDRTEAITKGRADERAPHEAAAEALLRDARFEDAEKAANAIKARWPDSKAALRILAEIEDKNRAHNLQAALESADAAESEGDVHRALVFYRKALGLGGDAAAIRLEISAIEARLGEAADEAAIARIVSRIDALELEAALLDYLELRAEVKERVRATAGIAIFALADNLCAGEGTKRLKQMVARAVPALTAAQAHLETDIDAAWRLVGPFPEMLQSLEAYQSIQSAYETEQRRRRKQRAIDALDDFAKAVSEERFSDADTLRNNVLPKDLDDEAKRRYAALEKQLAATRELDALKIGLDNARQQGDLFASRFMLEKLEETAPKEETSAYREQLAHLDERIRNEWRVWMLTGDDAEATQASLFKEGYGGGPDQQQWLSPDGKLIAIGFTDGLWFFGQTLETETGKPRRAFAARSDVPMDRGTDILFDGRTLVFNDPKGVIVKFDTETGRVLERFDYRRQISEDTIGEFALFIPKDDVVFHHATLNGSTKLTMKLISMRPPAVLKDLSEQGWMSILTPLDRLFVTTLRDDQECCVHNQKGYLQSRFSIAGAKELHGVQAHPDGERLILDVTYRSDDEGEDEGTLYIVSTDLNGQTGLPFKVDGSYHEYTNEIAASKAHGGLVFFRWLDEAQGMHLTALSVQKDGFGRLYDVITPRKVSLVRDIEGNRTAIMANTSTGKRFELLGPKAPDVTDWKEGDADLSPIGCSYISCNWPSVDMQVAAHSLSERMRGYGPKAMQKYFGDYIDKHRNDTDALLKMAHATCVYVGPMRDPVKTLERYIGLLPMSPQLKSELQLIRAKHCSSKSGWEDITRLLEDCDPTLLDEQSRGHYYHHRGLAAYHANDIARAKEWFAKMSQSPRPCTEAAPLFAMMGELPDGDDADILPKKANRSAVIIDAIACADRAIENHDWRGAMRILDTPAIWLANEQQSLARLLYVLQRSPALSAAETFRRIILTNRFIENETSGAPMMKAALKLGNAQWNEARIQSVLNEASTWLGSWRPPV